MSVNTKYVNGYCNEDCEHCKHSDCILPDDYAGSYKNEVVEEMDRETRNNRKYEKKWNEYKEVMQKLSGEHDEKKQAKLRNQLKQIERELDNFQTKGTNTVSEKRKAWLRMNSDRIKQRKSEWYQSKKTTLFIKRTIADTEKQVAGEKSKSSPLDSESTVKIYVIKTPNQTVTTTMASTVTATRRTMLNTNIETAYGVVNKEEFQTGAYACLKANGDKKIIANFGQAAESENYEWVKTTEREVTHPYILIETKEGHRDVLIFNGKNEITYRRNDVKMYETLKERFKEMCG